LMIPACWCSLYLSRFKLSYLTRALSSTTVVGLFSPVWSYVYGNFKHSTSIKLVADTAYWCYKLYLW
jgi:hypothetical protein